MNLDFGPNKITTIATDLVGRTASDSRWVYRDSGPPSLSWTPKDGTITTLSTITVSGMATDDNKIVKITVNAKPIAFTLDPTTPDPNDVTFSTTVDLAEGDNYITLEVTDNCKRTTTQTHKVIKVINRPPVADAGSDQTVEQTFYQGANVTLDGSGSHDPDGDPLTYTWTWRGGSAKGVSPTITFPLGTTTITLVVNDGMVDSEPDTVVVTVVDTTPPTVFAGDDLTVEQESLEGTDVTLTGYASDICDADLDYEWFEGATSLGRGQTLTHTFKVGVHTVTLKVTDDSGNTGSDEVIVNVIPSYVLLADDDIEVKEEGMSVFGNIHANGDIEIDQATIYGDITAVGKIRGILCMI